MTEGRSEYSTGSSSSGVWPQRRPLVLAAAPLSARPPPAALRRGAAAARDA